MSLQKIFLEEEVKVWKNVGNNATTFYKFDGTTLTIKQENKIKTINAQLGECFIVDFNFGKFLEISPIKVPIKNNQKIMWLLSFPKDARCNSLAEYESKITTKRRFYYFDDFSSFGIEGEKYKITFCNRADGGGIHHMIAYVSEDINKQEIIEMLHKYNNKNKRGIYFPKNFTTKFFRENFNLTEDEIGYINFIDSENCRYVGNELDGFLEYFPKEIFQENKYDFIRGDKFIIRESVHYNNEQYYVMYKNHYKTFKTMEEAKKIVNEYEGKPPYIRWEWEIRELEELKEDHKKTHEQEKYHFLEKYIQGIKESNAIGWTVCV
ncbi:hypothetical protein FDB23_03050 [Clostridium botulinum]|nr:hypothetical protein [Clostridium botulinum]